MVTTEPIYSAYSGEPEFQELLEVFVAGVAEKRAALEAAYGNGDIQDLSVQAHQLKGSGAGYGFQSLSETAADLERACRQSDVDAVAGALNQVLDQLDRVCA